MTTNMRSNPEGTTSPAVEDRDERFYEAVTAIDAGDIERLQRLLDAYPSLATDRLEGTPEWLKRQVGDAATGFFNRPYLLWFVAEDPVRNGRLPPNVADLIRLIVAAARRSNAATLQDQLDSTLRLVCWSGVAADAGLQLGMIDALIDEGAAPAKNQNNALVNGHVAAAAHLLFRGATPTLGAALCLERWDEAERLNAAATPEIRQFSLVLACLNGKSVGVEWILARGASPQDPSADLYAHGTPLHHAVCSGSLETVKALVKAGADPRQRDSAWNGTALGWAEHYVEESADPQRCFRYAEIVTYLRDLEGDTHT
jgi:peptide-methionine (S)-S-oxide reductase